MHGQHAQYLPVQAVAVLLVGEAAPSRSSARPPRALPASLCLLAAEGKSGADLQML